MRFRITIASVLFVITALAASPVRAQDVPDTDMVRDSEIVSNIRFRDVKILSQEGGVMTVSFGLENGGADIQPGVLYSVEAVPASAEGGADVVADRQVSGETLTLGPGERATRIIRYRIPETLSGVYVIRVSAGTSGGFLFDNASAGSVRLDGTADTVIVDQRSCFATVGNGAVRYAVDQGVDISTSEALVMHCQVTNPGEAKAFVPEYSTRKSSPFGSAMDNSDGAPVDVQGGHSEILLPISVPGTAGNYVTEVVLKDGDRKISSSMFLRYAVQGDSAVIGSVRIDRSTYKVADIAKVSYVVSGSADQFIGSRSPNRPFPASSLFLSLVDAKGDKCSDTVKADIVDLSASGNERAGSVSVPVTKECGPVSIAVSLSDMSGTISESETFSTVISPTEQLMDQGSINRGFPGIAELVFWVVIGTFLFGVIVAGTGYFRNRRTISRGIRNRSVLFLLIGLSAVSFLVKGKMTDAGGPGIASPVINNLSVGNVSVTSGQSTTLSWDVSPSSTDPSTTTCDASGSWSGSEPLSGSISTGSLSGDATFILTCTAHQSGLDSVPVSATVNVYVVPPMITGGKGIYLESWTASDHADYWNAHEAVSAPDGQWTPFVGDDNNRPGTDDQAFMVRGMVSGEPGGNLILESFSSADHTETLNVHETVSAPTNQWTDFAGDDGNSPGSDDSFYAIRAKLDDNAARNYSSCTIFLESWTSRDHVDNWNLNQSVSAPVGQWTDYVGGFGINSLRSDDQGFMMRMKLECPNVPPADPTVMGPTQGVLGTPYSFTATSTDANGDMLRYGFDWNMDGVVDTWSPSAGYVSSGMPETASRYWNATGSQAFQVVAEDASGVRSGWVSRTINIGLPGTLRVCLPLSELSDLTLSVNETRAIVVYFDTGSGCSGTVVTSSAGVSEGNPSGGAVRINEVGTNSLSMTANDPDSGHINPGQQQLDETITVSYSGQSKSFTVHSAEICSASCDATMVQHCKDESYSIQNTCQENVACQGARTCDKNWKEVKPGA